MIVDIMRMICYEILVVYVGLYTIPSFTHKFHFHLFLLIWLLVFLIFGFHLCFVTCLGIQLKNFTGVSQ
jgi:hypothetical protein